MGSKVDRRCALAALSMWLWMACVIVFLALVYAQAPAEKMIFPEALLPAALNAILLGFAGWASAGVRRGERLTAAAGALILYGVAALFTAAILLITGSAYEGSAVLIAWKAVLFAAWLASLVMVLRARKANSPARGP
jgi:hypothetical protein